MIQQVIDYIDINPEDIDMRTFYLDGRMCIAGIAYMLTHGKDALITANDSGDIDVIERVAQSVLGLNTPKLFYTYRWSPENRDNYNTAFGKYNQRAMADATIAELRLASEK